MILLVHGPEDGKANMVHGSGDGGGGSGGAGG